MMVTKGITCIDCDMGTCSGSVCTNTAFFRVDVKYTGSSWLFNWLDQDGSVVRYVQPSKPVGAYLIGSQPDWWKLDDVQSWKEPRFGNAWVSPMPGEEVVARIEARVKNNGQQYTIGSFDGQDATRIGRVFTFNSIDEYCIFVLANSQVIITPGCRICKPVRRFR